MIVALGFWGVLLIVFFLLVNSILGFGEVDAFDVESYRDDIDEKEADNWAIDFNEKLGRDTCHPNNQTNKNSDSNIDNILDCDIISFRLFENTKKPFSI